MPKHPPFTDSTPETLSSRIRAARRLCDILKLPPYGKSIVGVPGDDEIKAAGVVDRPFNLTMAMMAVAMWNEAGHAIEAERRGTQKPEPQAAQTGD